jgi:hypothetical protein
MLKSNNLHNLFNTLLRLFECYLTHYYDFLNVIFTSKYDFLNVILHHLRFSFAQVVITYYICATY